MFLMDAHALWQWYQTLLCPYKLDSSTSDTTTCDKDPLGAKGDEWEGVSVEIFATNQNQQYLTKATDPYVADELDRRTMSCAMCGHLERRLGTPPFKLNPPPVDDPGNDHLYTSNMDLHPFGAWLANDAGWTPEQTVVHSICNAYLYDPSRLARF